MASFYLELLGSAGGDESSGGWGWGADRRTRASPTGSQPKHNGVRGVQHPGCSSQTYPEHAGQTDPRHLRWVLSSGHIQDLQTTLSSSQTLEQAEESSESQAAAPAQPASVGLWPCLPPAHPPSFSSSSPPLHPLVPASSRLLPPPWLHWWRWRAEALLCRGCEEDGAKGEPLETRPPPPSKPPPDPAPPSPRHTAPMSHQRLSCCCSVLADLQSAALPADPSTPNHWCMGRQTQDSTGCIPRGSLALSRLQAHTQALLPLEHARICTHSATGLNTRETRLETAGEWPSPQAVHFIPIFFLLLFFSFFLSFHQTSVPALPALPKGSPAPGSRESLFFLTVPWANIWFAFPHFLLHLPSPPPRAQCSPPTIPPPTSPHCVPLPCPPVLPPNSPLP